MTSPMPALTFVSCLKSVGGHLGNLLYSRWPSTSGRWSTIALRSTIAFRSTLAFRCTLACWHNCAICIEKQVG